MNIWAWAATLLIKTKNLPSQWQLLVHEHIHMDYPSLSQSIFITDQTQAHSQWEFMGWAQSSVVDYSAVLNGKSMEKSQSSSMYFTLCSLFALHLMSFSVAAQTEVMRTTPD